MLKYISVSLFLIAIVAFNSSTASAASANTPQATVAAQNFNETVNNTSAIKNIISNITAVQSAITALQLQSTDLTNLQNTVTTNTSDINQLKSNMTGNITAISLLASSQNIMKLDIISLKQSTLQVESIPQIQNNIALMQNDITGVKFDISKINTDVDEMKIAQSSMGNKIEQISAQSLGVPVLKDGSGKVLGPVFNMSNITHSTNFEFYSSASNALFSINSQTGKPNDPGHTLRFSGENCTGQAYMSNAPMAVTTGGTTNRFFKPRNTNIIREFTQYRSSLQYNRCDNSYNTITSDIVLMDEFTPTISFPLPVPFSIGSSL